MPSGHRKIDVRETDKVADIVKEICRKEKIVGDIVEEYSIMVEPEASTGDQTMMTNNKTWGATLNTMGGKTKTLGANTLTPDAKSTPGDKGHVSQLGHVWIRYA